MLRWLNWKETVTLFPKFEVLHYPNVGQRVQSVWKTNCSSEFWKMKSGRQVISEARNTKGNNNYNDDKNSASKMDCRLLCRVMVVGD